MSLHDQMEQNAFTRMYNMTAKAKGTTGSLPLRYRTEYETSFPHAGLGSKMARIECSKRYVRRQAADVQ